MGRPRTGRITAVQVLAIRRKKVVEYGELTRLAKSLGISPRYIHHLRCDYTRYPEAVPDEA